MSSDRIETVAQQVERHGMQVCTSLRVSVGAWRLRQPRTGVKVTVLMKGAEFGELCLYISGHVIPINVSD